MTSKTLVLLIFGSGTVARLFLICFYGNEIEHNTQRFLEDVYETDWIATDKNSKRNLLIIKENLKKADKVRAASFLNINIEIFLSVMKAAYSMLAVLKQIK
jgi:hypothetical protein